jgi:hypothetical protein
MCASLSEARILWMALLAPDIIETVLEGRSDQALMLEQLERPLPASWTEQRGSAPRGRRARLGGSRYDRPPRTLGKPAAPRRRARPRGRHFRAPAMMKVTSSGIARAFLSLGPTPTLAPWTGNTGTKALNEAERELEVAMTRRGLNAAAKKLVRARQELGRLEQEPARPKRRRFNRVSPSADASSY